VNSSFEDKDSIETNEDSLRHGLLGNIKDQLDDLLNSRNTMTGVITEIEFIIKEQLSNQMKAVRDCVPNEKSEFERYGNGWNMCRNETNLNFDKLEGKVEEQKQKVVATPQIRIPTVGDALEITQDGDQVCVNILGSCIADSVAGFGDTVSQALRALVDEIEKQTRNQGNPK
jgi:hypothetical protein